MLKLIADSSSIKEIANTIVIAVGTIETQQRAIERKLQVHAQCRRYNHSFGAGRLGGLAMILCSSSFKLLVYKSFKYLRVYSSRSDCTGSRVEAFSVLEKTVKKETSKTNPAGKANSHGLRSILKAYCSNQFWMSK